MHRHALKCCKVESDTVAQNQSALDWQCKPKQDEIRRGWNTIRPKKKIKNQDKTKYKVCVPTWSRRAPHAHTLKSLQYNCQFKAWGRGTYHNKGAHSEESLHKTSGLRTGLAPKRKHVLKLRTASCCFVFEWRHWKNNLCWTTAFDVEHA